MSLTTDPYDPRLGHGTDPAPVPQNEVYLVLSEEERAKGFIRPVRRSYIHVGLAGPKYPLRDTTLEERQRHGPDYAKFEKYPDSEAPLIGRAWTQAQLDAAGKGCGTLTAMARELSETYARDPSFYGSTYCCGCLRHLRVAEFVWSGTDQRVGS